MAIDLEFRGIGDDILATIREAADLTAKLRGEVAATNEAQAKGAQQVIAAQEQVQATLEGSVIAVQELGKQSATQGKALSGELDKTGESASKLKGILSEVEKTDLKKLVDAAKQLAAAQGTVLKPLNAQQKAQFDQLVTVGAMTKEEAKLLEEVVQVKEAIEGGAEGVESLRGKLQKAKDEAAAIGKEFGLYSPQFAEAAAKAGHIAEEIDQINKITDSFNPGKQLNAVLQIGEGAVGAFTAVNSLLSAIGGESEGAEKALKRVEQGVGFLIGAQAAIRGFSEGWKSLRLIIGATTVAQEVSTTATEVDTVAKAANTTATVTLSTVTGGLTAAVRALSASLAISPLGLIALAVFAIGSAIAYITKTSGEAVTGLSKLADAFDEVSKKRLDQNNNANRLADIQGEIDLLKSGGDAAKERANIEARAARETATLTERRIQLESQLGVIFAEQVQNAIELNKALKDGDEDAIKSIQAQISANADRLKARRKEIDEAAQSEKEIAKTKELDILKFEADAAKESSDLAKQRAEERKRILAQLGNELEAIQKNVADRINAIELEEANPEQRLAIQRAAAEKEVNDLRTSELRKLAILQLVKDQRIKNINDLSQAEKDAAADAEIARGGVVLDPAREQQFQRLSLATWDAYFRDLSALQREQAEVRLALVGDTQQKELAAFEAQLTAQAELLRTKGQASEAEIEAFKTKQREDFGKKQAQQSRDIEEEIAVARVEAIKAGGDQSAEAQRAAELKILQIKLEAAQAALAALGEGTDQETRLRKAQLEKLIAELQGSIKAVQANRQPLDMFDLLGITFDNAEQKKAVEDAVSNVINLVEQSIAAQRAEVDAQISATDELIADRERRSDSLRQQLDQEIELAKLGLANNVDAVRAQIAENDKAAAAEKARKAKLIEDQKKLARQQLAIDAAQQASALITTGANLLANESLKGIVGAVAAIGFVASVFAAFASIKARAAAINSGGQQQFRDGGSSEGLIEGSRHGSRYGESGIAMYDRKTGKEVGEMEGGEYIVNREVSLKHRDIVEAMNRNDITTVYDLARQEIMGTNTVKLSSERVKEVVETKTTYENHTATFAVVENDKLRKDVQELTRVVKAFKSEQGKPKEQVVPIEGGYMVIKPNGDRETVRRRK